MHRLVAGLAAATIFACSPVVDVPPPAPPAPPAAPPPEPPPAPPPPPPSQPFGAPRRAVFASPTAPGTAGVPVGGIKVQIVDSAGVIVDTSTASVTVSLVGATGQLSGTTTVRATRGNAVFADLRIDKAAQHRLWAGAPGLRPDTMLVGIIPAAPARLAFTTPGRTIPADVRVTLGVDLVDAFGNRAMSGTLVELGLASAASGITLAGDTFALAQAGRATFDIIVRGTGDLAFRASAGGVPTITSERFKAIPGTVDTPRVVQGNLRFTSLGGGGEGHRCGLTSDGTAYCWGRNELGQLGNGTFTPSALPVAVAGGLRFTAITTAWGLSCGLTPARAVYCWGGVQSWRGYATPMLVEGSGSLAEIEASYFMLCGRTTDGRATCGVFNPDPAQGVPWTVAWQPAFTDPALRFDVITVSDARVCGRTTNGDVRCNGGFWMDDSYQWDLPQPENAGFVFRDLTGSSYHTCGLASTGEARCWGHNHGGALLGWSSGELGTGTLQASGTPVAVTGGHAFATLSAGWGHTCGITTGGTAWCWGTNPSGELGTTVPPDGANESGRPYYVAPTPVAGAARFREIYAGVGHTCGLTDAGEAYCWGANRDGELQDQAIAAYAARLNQRVQSLIAAARAASLRR